jgi:hypothetical protein
MMTKYDPGLYPNTAILMQTWQLPTIPICAATPMSFMLTCISHQTNKKNMCDYFHIMRNCQLYSCSHLARVL